MKHDFCYVANNLFQKLNEIIYNKTLYKLKHAKIATVSVLLVLDGTHEQVLPFTFPELDEEVMKTLIIKIQFYLHWKS